jgi:hypothetical protein
MEVCDSLLKKSNSLGHLETIWYKTHLVLLELIQKGAFTQKVPKGAKKLSYFESSIGVTFELYHYYDHSKFTNIVDVVLFDYTGTRGKHRLFTFPSNHKIDSIKFKGKNNLGIYFAIKIYKGRWIQTKLYLFFIDFSDFSMIESPTKIYQTLRNDVCVQLPKATNSFKLMCKDQPLCHLDCKLLNNESFHITLDGQIVRRSGIKTVRCQAFPKRIRTFQTKSCGLKHLLEFGWYVFLVKHNGTGYVTTMISFTHKRQHVDFCQICDKFILCEQTSNNRAKMNKYIDF